jgi:aerotaxis receptor
MSVRTKPDADEVARAETLYQQFREGSANGKRLFKGLIIRKGFMRWRSLFVTMPLRWRLRSALMTTFLLSILVGMLCQLTPGQMGMFTGVMASCFWR